jgi:hypothetical protein
MRVSFRCDTGPWSRRFDVTATAFAATVQVSPMLFLIAKSEVECVAREIGADHCAKSGSRGTRADQGVRPTLALDSDEL